MQSLGEIPKSAMYGYRKVKACNAVVLQVYRDVSSRKLAGLFSDKWMVCDPREQVAQKRTR